MAGERMVGIRTVAEALRDEDFPMDREGVAYAVGDIGVEDSRGVLVPVRIVLDSIPATRFATPEEVLRAISGAVDDASDRLTAGRTDEPPA